MATPHRRDRLRRLGFASLCVCALAAPLAEAQARHAITTRFSSQEIEIGIHGLRLAPFRYEAARVEVDALHVQPTFDGLDVEVSGLRLDSATASRDEAPSRAGELPASSDDRVERDPTWAALVRRVKGVPIRVVTHGELVLAGGSDFVLRVDSPRLTLPGDGSVDGSAELSLEHEGKRIAAAHVEVATHVDARETVLVSGLATTEGGATLQLRGQVHPMESLSLALDHPEGGSATVALHRGREDWVADINAHDFPLDAWPDAAESPSVHIDGAAFDGRAEVHLDRSRTRGRIHLADATVSGVIVDSRTLSPSPITFDDLSLTGDLAFDRASDRVFGDLVVAHGPAQVRVSGERSPERTSFYAELPTTACQTLAEAMPRGFLPVLEGMRFSGDVSGSLELDFAPDAVRAAALRELAEDAPAPGRLDVHFPFLEHCTVVADAPGVDLEGLLGPYRHRFLSDGGRERQRIMAKGADDYVPLARVPRLAAAFLVLEDSRFHSHDGFDRRQIERALWHNLGVGGMKRGASTISQQTARNLWLGVDRSLGRKVQEAVLTARLEAEVPKDRIFELYLNLVELGPEVHGVREAALFHFGREPEELNLLEALHLAAHAPAPVTTSRRFAGGQVDEVWRADLEEQLRRLRLHGLVSAEEAQAAHGAPIRLRRRSSPPS